MVQRNSESRKGMAPCALTSVFLAYHYARRIWHLHELIQVEVILKHVPTWRQCSIWALSELFCASSMSRTAALRLPSALARTAADLSEQRCSSRAKQMVPQGAGLASSAMLGTTVAAVSKRLLASVLGPDDSPETACEPAGVAASDDDGVPRSGLRIGVLCVA